MAFNFLGTLCKEDLNELRVFLTSQIDDIDAEVNYLYVEYSNMLKTQAELLEADSKLGGTTSSILPKIFGWVDKAGITTNIGTFNYVQAAAKADDGIAADPLEQAKRPFISTIKYKKERLEYKLKKISDAIEQTNEMIDRKSIAKTKTTALLNTVESMFNSTENNNFLFQSRDEMENYQKQSNIDPTTLAK